MTRGENKSFRTATVRPIVGFPLKSFEITPDSLPVPLIEASTRGFPSAPLRIVEVLDVQDAQAALSFPGCQLPVGGSRVELGVPGRAGRVKRS
jgi:hypothetical protein